MKKIIIPILIVVLVTPNFALASWWNPLDWFNNWHFSNKTDDKTEILEQRIKELENKLEKVSSNATTATKSQTAVSNDNKEVSDLDIKNEIDLRVKSELEKILKDKNISNSKPVETLISVTPPPTLLPQDNVIIKPDNDAVLNRKFDDSGKISLSNYVTEVSVTDYIKNPKIYLSKPIKLIEAKIVDFNTDIDDYIEVVDSHNTSSDSIFIKIDNIDDYTTVVDELKKSDTILIYGYGSNRTKFNVVGNGGSYDSYEATIEADAIFRCTSICRYTYAIGVKEVFLRNNK